MFSSQKIRLVLAPRQGKGREVGIKGRGAGGVVDRKEKGSFYVHW